MFNKLARVIITVVVCATREKKSSAISDPIYETHLISALYTSSHFYFGQNGTAHSNAISVREL